MEAHSIGLTNSAPIAYKGRTHERRDFSESARDNSTAMTIGGGAGAATFGAVSKSSKIGTNVVRLVNNSKKIKADKQAQILEVLAKFKPLARFTNNPIVRRLAGGLAGLSAATTLVGSSAKIADTYGYLSNKA